MLSNKFMIVGVLASIFATLLAAVSLISIDKRTKVLEDLSWAHGDTTLLGVDTDIYVGVLQIGFVYTTGGSAQTTKEKYTSDNCSADFCDKCHKEMPIVYGFLAGFCFLSLFSIFSDMARFRDDSNTRGHRSSSVGTSFLAIGCGLVSLIVFATGCLKKVEDYASNSPSDFKWEYGVSFILLAAAICLKVLDILVNMLVSTAGIMGCC